jgi:gamma-glutamyltranspeptidase / glutathione hydrolase
VTTPGFTTRPELQGSFGMVSSTHWLASAAGMAMLEGGGNAFDAAAAAAFTLQVVEPHLNGPAGDLPVIFAEADGQPTVLCAQGTAPAGATIAHYRDYLGLDLVPGTGLLAAAIPGATPGWLTLLRDKGTKLLRDVLDFAIHYAEHGIPVLPQITSTITSVRDLLREEWTTSARVWLPGGEVPQPGSWLRNPTWAATLRRLVVEAEAASADRGVQIDHALRSWSSGFVAAAVEKFARTAWMDSSGERHAGVITAADMARWAPTYEQPSTIDFRGWTFAKTGPWGQGPVLLQQLALLDGFELRPGTADYIHKVVECAKLAFADREAFYGDAAPVPLDDLLSVEYTAARRALVGDSASGELRPGRPGGREPVLPPYPMLSDAMLDNPTVGEPTVNASGQTKGDTCHVDVVDQWGNIVAAMPSGGWLQSSPVIGELGFCLGTRLQMTWLADGLPASLTPGRRPRTTLSPSLGLRDGQALLAFGTPGGDQQDQWQVDFLLKHVVGGMNLQEAIDAPTFHTTHFPSSFYPRGASPRQVVVEDRFDSDVLDELRSRGHEVSLSGAWSLARICAVSRSPDNSVLRAAANPRGMQGYAAGR